MKKVFKWVLFAATAICLFMSVWSLVADYTVTTKYDFELNKQVVIGTSECPCWNVAIPFMIASAIGIVLIVIFSIYNKKSSDL